MQPEDVEIELPSPCLNGLDSALQRLGMLATSADSRREYLKEIQRKPYLNMVRINTRYVSNVSIGFRVRPLTPHVRYKPYAIRERHRTRSENNDSENDASLVKAVVDQVIEDSVDLAQLKKAKSLESIVAESGPEVDLHNISFPELEVVSNCIQNLKVVE
ncbi:uncharacterized protein LOC663388 [Tribolium castaneum]|uniref:Uncharacterized protein n=1 Tax=Tribolium castaneum TaxID=7070 RepID=D6WWJ1_TRICA|nr:PREDICTED: uncharacterized protein LOC663388 [Tribolium castaneum]EFA08130.1 hypothetical protein TcasGA2_TC005734 [Tribolium castaneum]|eukprot:XP_976451.1 PREDICTED: uncharacterized protein LOC663388 [Tribolium castaneum]